MGERGRVIPALRRAEQLVELLDRVALGQRRVEDQPLLRALLELEDRVLEPQLAQRRVLERLRAGAAAGDLVALPPAAELLAALAQVLDQLLEVRVAQVARVVGAKAGERGARAGLPVDRAAAALGIHEDRPQLVAAVLGVLAGVAE